MSDDPKNRDVKAVYDSFLDVLEVVVIVQIIFLLLRFICSEAITVFTVGTGNNEKFFLSP